MPRKKLIYTHMYPYHICARANNKQNFPISTEKLWEISSALLNQSTSKYKFIIHAFVLMNNHYHLLGSTHENFNLGTVMCWLQTSISKAVNYKTQRINHVFGGPYKASLITSPIYFANVTKYVFRNPVKAGLCNDVRNYQFSTLNNNDCTVASLINGFYSEIPKTQIEYINWLNEAEENNKNISIQKGLTKTLFKPMYCRNNRF